METKPTLTPSVMATSVPLAWLALSASAIAQQVDTSKTKTMLTTVVIGQPVLNSIL